MKKHVNRNIRGKSGKIGERGAVRRGKSGKTGNRQKAPCLSRDVQNTAPANAELLPNIPGVEQLDFIPVGSKLICDGFFADEAALLKQRATGVMDRRTIFVFPRVGWPKGIYRKPETQEAK